VNSRNLGLVLIAFIAVAACSDSPSVERVSTSVAALQPPELTPVPCLQNGPSSPGSPMWAGTTPELLFADTVVSCLSLDPPGPNPFDNIYGLGDLYMANIVSNLMTNTLTTINQNCFTGDPTCTPDHKSRVTAPIPFSWSTLRASANYSCDPVTLRPASLGVVIPPLVVRERVTVADYPGRTFDPPQTPIANNELRVAGVNFCIASRLRQLIPGSAGGQSLLFSDSEQRELLEIIRERSQIAMLQYALLGEVFAAGLAGTPDPVNPFQIAGTLSAWAPHHAGPNTKDDRLTGMGSDFAADVQLNHAVSEELGQLFARSRSADASSITASPTANQADRYWGPASWQQRAMTFGFGGDPLVIGPNGPWPPPVGSPIPGTFTNRDWPNFFQAPYVRTNIDSPQVNQLWLMAKRFDAIRVHVFHPAPDPSNGQVMLTDPASTAADIYNRVENNLRVANCAPLVNGACPTLPADPSQPPSTLPYPAYLLLTRYGISYDHAAALASLLADEAIALMVDPTLPAGTVSDISQYQTGALDITGADSNGTVTSTSTSNGAIVHISPNAQFVSRTLAQMGPVYAQAAPLRFPRTSEITADLDSGSLAMAGPCGTMVCVSPYANDAAEAKRTMGALAANAATRDMLLDAMNVTASGQNPLLKYFQFGPKIIETLTGAAGIDSVRIATAVRQSPPSSSVPVYNAAGGTWDVSVTHAADDPWWTQGTSYLLYALQGPNVSNLAAHQEVTWNGDSLTGRINDALSARRVANPAGNVDVAISNEIRTIFQISVPSPAAHYTFVVEGDFPAPAPAPKGSPPIILYRLLGANVNLPTSAPHYGQYLAYGGTLGTWLNHQNQTNPQNPSEPAYDGFDLPIHWVPPFSAQVLGGNPGDSIVNSYLSLAKSSADDATKAVQTAVDGLLQEGVSLANQKAAADKAALGLKQDQDELCGKSAPLCDPGFSTVYPWQVVGYPVLSNPAVPPLDKAGPGDIYNEIDHFVYTVVQPLYQTQVPVANAVVPYLSNSAAPTFDFYSGGSLQQVFIEQWAALREPLSKIQALQKNAESVKAQIGNAQQVISSLNLQAQQQCGPQGIIGALFSCISFGLSAGTSTGPGIQTSSQSGGGGGFSFGPLFSLSDQCSNLQLQTNNAWQQEWAAEKSAFASLATAASDFVNSAAAMVQSGAKIQSVLLKARDAMAKETLEGQLESGAQVTSFGLFREYRAYDVWRARALLENARRYALAARRAIEARYVVDLSKLTQPETFVASPAKWANDIYSYDLSMPSAVGLSVGAPTAGGIYVNKISDYVTNLEGFVSGFAATRPSAVDQGELDVVALPGLVPGAPLTFAPPAGDGGTPEGGTDAGDAGPPNGPTTDFASVASWTLHCPGGGPGGQWVIAPRQTGDVDNACAAVGGASGVPLTYTFQDGANGYKGTQDTLLYGNTAAGGQNLNYGANPTIQVYERETSTTNSVRTLIRFDLSSLQSMLAQGYSIHGAQLTLTLASNADHLGVATSLYRVSDGNANWVEGTAIATTQPGSSDWNHRIYNTQPWAGSPGLSTPGADYVPTPLATANAPLTAGGTMTLTLSDVSFLADWINNPTHNAGFLVRQASGSFSVDQFNSREASTVASRPQLVVTFNAHPDRARLEFALDPWGRVNGAVANPPFAKRFNARWNQMAVNFVGTALKDCTKAADPQGCYASEYIPYNLTHVGPAWITDYNEAWHQLDVPIGQVEGGKGLAAEIWLDPLKDGWSTSFISGIARTEYELRPLGGAYVLEFPVGPEVVLQRLQRVQILIGSSAWVKQQ
jgi:hypothetical protein